MFDEETTKVDGIAALPMAEMRAIDGCALCGKSGAKHGMCIACVDAARTLDETFGYLDSTPSLYSDHFESSVGLPVSVGGVSR